MHLLNFMKVKAFGKKLIAKFIADDTTTLAASLAFYTALSLAPLLILFVAISSRLDPNLQQALIGEINDVVGFEAAKAVSAVIHSAKAEPHLTSVAGFVGVGTLLFSASLIFGSLRDTLNRILAAPLKTRSKETLGRVIFCYLRDRLLHIALAVAFILTMILSLLISTLYLGELHAHTPFAAFLNYVISAAFYVVVFSLLFHFLPNRPLPWKRAIQGGALTAVLFVIGKELIAIYLGGAALGSPYGAAGSIIVFLVWVYYSALITFFGAQVSSLLGNNAPKRLRPRP
jgi:membrane protein